MKELIILVGYPACGKTTYALHIKHKRINQDSLGSKQKCLKLFNYYVKNKDDIVIDNTNTIKKIRQEYINIAKQENYYIICMNFTNNMKYCMEQNDLRCKRVPKVVYYKIRKHYENPTLDEGFDLIESVFSI